MLAAQQLRGIETGSKLAGLPAFVPVRAVDQAAGTTFSVQFVFSGGQTERITTGISVTKAQPNTTDAEAEPDDVECSVPDSLDPP